VLYAVGDIHGQLDLLDELLEKLPLGPDDRLLFIGDYIDRGPDARGVVQRLIDLELERDCTFLLGNHESMFLDFIGWRGESYFGGDAFLPNGGDRTLASYGYFDLDDPEPANFVLPKSHEEFYSRLKLFHLEGDYLFVHAGIGRRLLGESEVAYALRRARPQDLLWDRASADLPHALGVTVVYGHTPAPDFKVRWNRPYGIGIDTGAVYGGFLTAIRLPDETIFHV
jgi:serine/threonine protein phosphatase 1